jgi:iron(III) transport system permease protein
MRQAIVVSMEKRLAKLVAGVALSGLLPLIVGPIAFLVFGASLDSEDIAGGTSRLTFRFFREIASRTVYWEHLGNSLILGVCTAALSTVIGVFISWVLWRVRPYGRSVLDVLMIVPFFLSSFIAAMAWARLGNPSNGLLNLWLSGLLGRAVAPFNVYSWPGLIFVMTTLTVPFVYMLTAATLQSVDPALEEAASMNGAGRLRRLLDVTLPLVMPSILGGALLAMMFALEAFAEPSILGVPAGLAFLTTDIYAAVKNYPARFGTGSALAVCLMALTMLLVYVQGRLIGHRSFVAFGGKGGSSNLSDRMMGRSARLLVTVAVALYVFVAIVLPYVALTIISFQRFTSTRLANWTMDNYRAVVGPNGVIEAFANSFVASLVSAVVSMAWMFCLAHLMSRSRFRSSAIVGYIATMPIAVPGIVFGVALLWMWLRSPIPVYGSLILLLIAYVARFSPYVFRGVSAAITQVDRSLEESGRMNGAGPIRTLLAIVFPLIRPSLLSGGLIFALFAMRDLNVSILLSTPGSKVLSVAIWEMWESGQVPRVAAAAVLQTLALVVIFFIARALGNRAAANA